MYVTLINEQNTIIMFHVINFLWLSLFVMQLTAKERIFTFYFFVRNGSFNFWGVTFYFPYATHAHGAVNKYVSLIFFWLILHCLLRIFHFVIRVVSFSPRFKVFH